jgi:hypothetical protein
LAFLLYTYDMNWQNKIYTVILEHKKENRDDTITKNVEKLRSMEDGPEKDKLKSDTMNLITGGRKAGRGAIETAPRRRKNLRDTSR